MQVIGLMLAFRIEN